MEHHDGPLEKTAQAYHANAAIPDIHIENIYQHYFNRWLTTQIDPGSRVLEMGYGDGIVTGALAGSDCKLTVLEGAGTLAAIARSTHPGVEVIQSMFEDFEPSSPFETVIASHVLEHVDSPRSILARIRKWLAPGGRMIAAVPNKRSIHRQLAVLMGLQPKLDALSARDHMVGHKRVYSLQELTSEIESEGLSVESSAGFFLKVLPNSMMLDYPEPLLKALNEISPLIPPDLLANLAVVARKVPGRS